MPLSAGTKIGPYEIIAPIGAGGMGEVYRARDTTLKRDVAIKVLPEAFFRDPERMARFQREAEVLASLNHPNIGHIYGIVDSEDSRGLVLGLIEGPTLADRLEVGPIPLDEAVAISKQIVDALEYAHDRGVVHRDLKPANIKIADGAVKVLDFGLAKVLEDDPAPSPLADSPTLALGHTRTGMILGTAAYMSPEQAVGRPVDRRSDIFSFGAVLYEMLTGKRAFTGATTPDVLEAVVKNDPDWSALPAGTPRYLRRLIERTLAKDRKQRLQAIGEARIALEKEDSGADSLPDKRADRFGSQRLEPCCSASDSQRAWLSCISAKSSRAWSNFLCCHPKKRRSALRPSSRLTGWPTLGLRRNTRRQERVVGARSGFAGCPPSARNRGRYFSFLVPRQPIDWIFRGQETEEDRSRWRASFDSVRSRRPRRREGRGARTA